MTTSAEPLGPADVIPIASNLTADDGAFIVGGQATNLWAWYYQDRVPYLRNSGPFTSQDIDYFGGIDVAQKLADALNGKVLRPGRDTMNTPNTAIVEVELNGRNIRIDFLGKLLGIKNREFANGVSELQLKATIDNKDISISISLMHPLLCLKSRVASLMHPATRRRDETAMRQIHAAYHISKVFISHSLEDGDEREATNFFQGVFEYVRRDEFGRRAHIETPIDPLGILKNFITDDRIDIRYREHNLNSQIREVEEFRVGLEGRLARGQ